MSGSPRTKKKAKSSPAKKSGKSMLKRNKSVTGTPSKKKKKKKIVRRTPKDRDRKIVTRVQNKVAIDQLFGKETSKAKSDSKSYNDLLKVVKNQNKNEKRMKYSSPVGDFIQVERRKKKENANSPARKKKKEYTNPSVPASSPSSFEYDWDNLEPEIEDDAESVTSEKSVTSDFADMEMEYHKMEIQCGDDLFVFEIHPEVKKKMEGKIGNMAGMMVGKEDSSKKQSIKSRVLTRKKEVSLQQLKN